ncbi:tetrapyrrole methylase [Gemella sp. GH3]|uniref:SAM-dependent methyltransferase n=1 Tax=unclassified Gemella TaxID=2624949 RepID=UPI0015D08142|nr:MULTISPECIES: SAM-dependent methyltransferase [unclassified Gemella]MBF0714589.1 tetrapyrrole methylase [Gemella sp. GH3.1]NYS51541.1 tetrapyrrole methylase [Gemella sp. GH3]
MIYIIGLGPNNSLNIKDSIKQMLLTNKDKFILARTKEHPAISFLDDNNIYYETCDRFYEQSDNFSETYENIVAYILQKNKNQDVMYLVPGHPMVAELTTKLLLEKSEKVEVIGGESFLDSCFNAAKFDPVEGFTLVDATDLEAFKNIDPRKHLLITQCYDDITAGDISVELDRYYPFFYPVTIMEQVGCDDEKIYTSSLAELSASVGEKVNNLRTIYIPPFKEAADYNLQNYLPDYEEENYDLDEREYLYKISDAVNDMLVSIRSVDSNVNEVVAKNFAKVLKNMLAYTMNATVGYVELEEIMKKLEEIQK